LIAK